MTSEDDTGQELEDGQEVCPFCNNIVWPGAMQYCDHYLWTRWDGQVIWEIDAASTLIEVASEIFDCLLDAEEEGWLQEALDQADEQFGKLVALARDPTAVSVDDFISPDGFSQASGERPKVCCREVAIPSFFRCQLKSGRDSERNISKSSCV